jgi:hypothetical protein
VNWHHRRAAVVLAVTVILNVILGTLYGFDDNIGVWHGLYCSTGIATTVGCDVPPNDVAGYVLSTLMMLLVVPLFTATFSLFTSGLVASHVDDRTSEQTAELKDHISGT